MNNKEYKAIVKKAAKRFERLQELELKDSNRIKNRVNWFRFRNWKIPVL